MASTYLVLINNVLRDINEVELTSTTFSSSRGIQTSVKDFVNRSITDIINSELNWPFTRAGGTLDLVSGSPAANSKFGNTMKLTSASATQAMSDLIVGKSYDVVVKLTGATTTVTIGTSSGGSQTKSQTITLSNTNDSSYTTFAFTATAATHYITFAEASGSNAYVGSVTVTQADINPQRLKFLTYEEWNDNHRERDTATSVDKVGVPDYVYTTYNDEVGFSPIPDSDNLSIKFDYYTTHTDLSSHDDTSVIPTRFEPVIIARARYYAFMLRSDLQNAQFANQEYQDGVKRMRVELINRKAYMRAV